jgi:hypothetical protein
MHPNVALALSLIAASAFAQEEVAPPPPPPPAAQGEVSAPAPAPAPAEPAVSDHTVGLHLAANVGLFSLDVHQGRLYGFVAGNAGVPLLSNGQTGSFALGLGASFAVSPPAPSMWFFDVFAMTLPGWTTQGNGREVAVGIGIGAGFRYLHRSGLTFGFKVPIFGASVGPGATSVFGGTGQMVSTFYLQSAIALPMLSVGYRF